MQTAHTVRGKFVSKLNDHLGLKPTVSIVTIAKVAKENAFDSITPRLATKERWNFEGKK